MRKPEGARVIAFLQDPIVGGSEGLHVCLVSKDNGVVSFPKGRRRHWKAETIHCSAARHWRHETGLPMRRLNLIDEAYVDDPGYYACRYLVGNCTPPWRDAARVKGSRL